VTTDPKAELKEFALSIVRGQTNVYVKELLRERGVRIGATKKDFDRNLSEAIDQGVLTRSHLQKWLDDVEGWGQQHVYVYRLTPEETQAFSTSKAAHQRVRDARLAKYWRSPKGNRLSVQFPYDEQLHLASITYLESLLFQWYKGTKYWTRTKKEQGLDKPVESIAGFDYEFRAYRGQSMREVMRFEIRPTARLAALFIPRPAHSQEHRDAYAKAKTTLGRVVNFPAMEGRLLRLSQVIKILDQRLAFPAGHSDDNAVATVRPESTRLKSGVASVEFAADAGFSYFDSAGVKRVRDSLRSDADIKGFSGTEGTFRFDDLGRVQLSASDDRIKIWSSLKADDVWRILTTLAANETGG